MPKDKIVEALEHHPSGLSISDLARESGLHRNTVSSRAKELLKEDTVKYKKVGRAKVYYLNHHKGLHEGIKMSDKKNIRVNIGVSDLEDGYKAAVYAAQQAVMGIGSDPTFSIVLFSSEYDPHSVAAGIQKILTGTHWVGCRTNRELNHITGISKGTIQVLSIKTKHMHFHTEVADNYRENPQGKGKEAATRAASLVEPDRLVSPYVQFSRLSSQNYIDIVRTPPYFILTFISGMCHKEDGTFYPGMESKFLEGIFNALGPNIPVFGASVVSDFDGLMQGYKCTNYILVDGKVYENAALVTFVVSDLYFSHGLEHGHKPSDRMALITKLSDDGHTILELNEKGAVEEYSRILGIDQEEFLKNFHKHAYGNPLGVIDVDGSTYIKSIIPCQDGKSLCSISKLTENVFVNILSFDKESAINAMSDAISQAKKDHEDKEAAFALIFSCSGRRAILDEDADHVLEITKSKHVDMPLFGFYSFGEIGAKKDRQSQYNNQTVTTLLVYDKLLSQ